MKRDTWRVCIYGAGAVGGYVGTRLALAGCDVAAVARGATAAALRAHGFRTQTAQGLLQAPVRVAEDPAELGPQDLVVIAVKAPAMPAVAVRIAPLLGDQTMAMVAMNGVPWWFFRGFGGDHAGMQLDSIDPGGRIAAAIPDRHVIGCVVHFACSVPEPGLVKHGIGNRLIIGEPSGAESPRVLDVAERLRAAGFEAPVSRRIQAEIWYKLWGNMTMNPISALTGSTADRILDDPLLLGFVVAVMEEAAAIGARIGCPIAESALDRIAVTRRLGPFKTSMLQDIEARRPPEIDALLTVVHEIGAKVGIPTPGTDALLGLARVQARTLGLYG